jgi:NitT/TauT family transport system ATP-binding protein
MESSSINPDPAAGYLSLEHVSMSYPVRSKGKIEHLKVLDDITMQVGRGEFVCLIGPSGCGKSTLLRIVDGLIRAESGSVTVGGVPTMAPRQDMGVVFQSFNLFPWRTVISNVELGLENRGLGSAERTRRAQSWIELVGLSGFEDFYPSQLSGGMQQRVGLARALAIEPDILLMDEPFGSVDAQTRLLMQEELLRIWAMAKKTVVFVTHDVEEAIFLGDRVVVFSRHPGRIVDIIDVPFERPRTDTLRGDAHFAQLKEELWERLKTRLRGDEDSGSNPDGGIQTFESPDLP